MGWIWCVMELCDYHTENLLLFICMVQTITQEGKGIKWLPVRPNVNGYLYSACQCLSILVVVMVTFIIVTGMRQSRCYKILYNCDLIFLTLCAALTLIGLIVLPKRLIDIPMAAEDENAELLRQAAAFKRRRPKKVN
jgi:hypothetical protein